MLIKCWSHLARFANFACAKNGAWATGEFRNFTFFALFWLTFWKTTIQRFPEQPRWIPNVALARKLYPKICLEHLLGPNNFVLAFQDVDEFEPHFGGFCRNSPTFAGLGQIKGSARPGPSTVPGTAKFQEYETQRPVARQLSRQSARGTSAAPRKPVAAACALIYGFRNVFLFGLHRYCLNGKNETVKRNLEFSSLDW